MGFLPHYQRIANDIRAHINSGDLKPGDQLPSITQLKKQYGASAQPVKTALLVLHTEGWTEGRQGRGVFVADRRPPSIEHVTPDASPTGDRFRG